MPSKLSGTRRFGTTARPGNMGQSPSPGGTARQAVGCPFERVGPLLLECNFLKCLAANYFADFSSFHHHFDLLLFSSDDFERQSIEFV